MHFNENLEIERSDQRKKIKKTNIIPACVIKTPQAIIPFASWATLKWWDMGTNGFNKQHSIN